MSENATRSLYMLCNVYAWSNNPRKPPRFGRKWASDIPQKRKKYLWCVTITVWTDGSIGITDAALATEVGNGETNREE